MERNILKEIVELKRGEVTELKKSQPLADLKERIERRRHHRDFYAAMADSADDVRIIAEIKRASPSRGIIDEDIDPAKVAVDYQIGGAKAISILTEREFFMGSLQDLEAVRDACSLPILRKDFTIDEYQIYESAAVGADAILLIVRLLEKQQLKDYIALATQLGIDCLVEIHHDSDVEKLEGSGAKIVGINNRDLQTFETSLDVAIRMAGMLGGQYLAVAASGIFGRDDIDANLAAGIHCFLIGESLVRAADSVAFLKELRGVDA
ncbi:MAG TPA: indole-3-glycerol phosphate synthase TrpC [Phycisphaerae bacterium]|nr:indole-3-glycerol phosphate synthase TrpC [Phycisphaerae bacterium]HPS52235.1 indole-3-glycerol phosphate synthase TrpC [Phycisphaerae bacterium]